MFDIGWTEMLVVAVVAIIVVGPKDLPGMLRTVGNTVKKVRAMAGDFQKQFDDALKEAELDGLRDSVNDVRSLDPTKAIKDKLNPLKSELDDVKKSVAESTDFDPKEIFDESKAPSAPKPQTVDVEAALKRQQEIDAEFAKVAPSSGVNAVPGFGGPAADPSPADATPKAKPKATAKKSSTAAKASVKKARQKPTAKKPTAKEPALKSAKATKKPAVKRAAQKSKKPLPKADA